MRECSPRRVTLRLPLPDSSAEKSARADIERHGIMVGRLAAGCTRARGWPRSYDTIDPAPTCCTGLIFKSQKVTAPTFVAQLAKFALPNSAASAKDSGNRIVFGVTSGFQAFRIVDPEVCCRVETATRREENSMNRKTVTTIVILSVSALFGAAPLATSAVAAPSTLKTIDTDNDGTVDLNEARAAASALFDRLDRDHDGTLDRKELRGRVSTKQLAEADPDHDGTLTKEEYLSLVATRFKAADPDNDGTLDAKELKGLARLLK